MMTEDAATRYIHDTVTRMDSMGKRPTMLMVHPDYHLLVSTSAAKYGLRLIINPDAPLDRFMFR